MANVVVFKKEHRRQATFYKLLSLVLKLQKDFYTIEKISCTESMRSRRIRLSMSVAYSLSNDM